MKYIKLFEDFSDFDDDGEDEEFDEPGTLNAQGETLCDCGHYEHKLAHTYVNAHNGYDEGGDYLVCDDCLGSYAEVIDDEWTFCSEYDQNQCLI